MKISFEENSESFPVEVVPLGKGYRLKIGDETYEVEVLQSKDGKMDLSIDGKHVTTYVSSDNALRWVTVNGRTSVLTKSAAARKGRHGGHHAAGELTAPMPGQVRAVSVQEGESVAKGQTLLVLEAMKMEIRVHSPQDGVVKKVFVQQGQTVEREQFLIEIEEI